MKLLVTLLTSNDLPRLKRLINSFLNQVDTRGIFTEVRCVIVVNTLSDEYYQEVLRSNLPFPVVRTESNGRPGKGKNSCLDLFLNSDFDFLSQIDGDDILYPTFLRSLEEHISRMPCLDVLGVIPMDVITDERDIKGYAFKVAEGVHAGVWGISLVTPHTSAQGPGRSYMWDQDYPISADFIILQSRKSAQHKLDENMGVGEDHLYSLQLLSEHQKGNLCYFHTMSSDMFVIDRLTEGSVQKTFPQAEHVQALKDNARKYLVEHRSSIWELPIIYKELLLNPLEKEAWIKKIY